METTIHSQHPLVSAPADVIDAIDHLDPLACSVLLKQRVELAA